MSRAFPVATLLIVAGFWVSIWHFWDKRRWFNLLRHSKFFGEESRIQFTADKVLVSGPTSKGEMTWEAIEDIELANNGAFVVLQKGWSIYVPKVSNGQSNNLSEIIEFYDKLKT